MSPVTFFFLGGIPGPLSSFFFGLRCARQKPGNRTTINDTVARRETEQVRTAPREPT
jgi:hypothetical protein